MTRPSSILFICTKFGGRSVLAAHLCNQLSPWGNIAQASSFESGKLPKNFFDLMHALGYNLPAEQPPSLFERYKCGETFDYAVVMCSEESGEQCPILSLSVEELYGKQAKILNWSVPDLFKLGATPQGFRSELIQVAEGLEQRIRGLLADL